MKFILLALTAAIITVNADPVKYQYHRLGSRKGFGASFSTLAASPFGLSNHKDLFYFLDVQVCGQNFSVQLDTGSSDLFVYPPSPLTSAIHFPIPINLTYADGSNVLGNTAVCPVSFSHYSIPNQTFLDATTYTDTTGLYLPANVLGLMGLGFDLNSQIFTAIQAAPPGAAVPSGLSVLSNLFLLSPATPNYIAFLFDRASELDSTPSTGSFTVGENHPGFEGILNQPTLPLYPANSTEWTTLLDSVDVNGQTIKFASTVPGAPGGKSVALLDTGTSFLKAPKVVVDAIYSGIPQAEFDADYGWIVPCLAEANVGLTFAGNRFAIHPLDMTVVDNVQLKNGSNATLCYAAIDSIGSTGGNSEDFILGDAFLRNVYSLYDFGDTDASGKPIGTPYMKLLTVTDPVQASADFKKQRAKALASLPPPLIPLSGGPGSPTKSTSIRKAVPRTLGVSLVSIGVIIISILG